MELECPDCNIRNIDDLDGVSEFCPKHWIAHELTFFLHFEGHENCCDIPVMEGLLREWKEDVIRRAIGCLHKSRQKYARKVLDYAIKGELEA